VRALTRASRAFFEQPPAGFTDQALLTPRGELIIGTTEQVPRVEAEFETIRQYLRQVRIIGEKEIRGLVPVLLPEYARAAVFEAGAADIDVHALHQGFIRGLKARGGELQCDVGIRAIGRVGEEWSVETDKGVLRAPLLIDAAGAWADDVAALAGVAPLHLQPRRRSAFLFSPPAGVATAHWPFVFAIDESFYFKPDAGLLLGSPANADPVSAHDVQPEEIDIATGIYRIEEATTLRIHRPTRTWAGLRTFAPGGRLVGGFAPDAPDFFWVAGLGGYGIQTSPAMGDACAHLALDRALPSYIQDAGINAGMLAPELSE
jgi:D-arginine dehydrogenase